ncbi:MAG: hypothetical protein PHX78_10775 [bacterium]|nr:hypothetical protein [bacterium]
MPEKNNEYPIIEMKFTSEEDLIYLVKQKLGQVEPDIKIIKEKKLSFEDEENFYLLAHDQNKKFVLIAVKIYEDENWLYRIVDHLEWFQHYLQRSHDTLPQNERIALNLKDARIILIAPSFSDPLKKCVPYLSIPLSLYEYRYLKVGYQQGLLLNPIKWKSMQIENVVELNINPPLKPILDNFINKLSKLDTKIILNYEKNHIDLTFNEQSLGQIRFAKKFFWIDTGLGSWQSICVENEASSHIAWEKIKLIYLHLGGENEELLEEDMESSSESCSPVKNPNGLTQEEIMELSKIDQDVRNILN